MIVTPYVILMFLSTLLQILAKNSDPSNVMLSWMFRDLIILNNSYKPKILNVLSGPYLFIPTFL